ncbi:E3 SUMO-protein ligase MMS21-like [Pyrus ussuriensis x Pyrus communis]|uniref:E3 SUMO-protein ligase MMS21-like n=1 Tax=Pyrus ussuriensis x Pyrus communis TaxID=2448454 RepID=A0A5N5GKR5_9ROSA|nr:E3 SUMO-protein ligase MMS21-like [Pyrus ussuriensis x Pyrus communis]
MDFFHTSNHKNQFKHSKKRLTQDQVKLLEISFASNNKLEPERKLLLAKQLAIPPRQVAIWYQNKRARWKTQSLEFDYSAIQAKLESTLAEKMRLEKDVERLRGELKKAHEIALALNQQSQVFPDNPVICSVFDSSNCSDEGVGSSSLQPHEDDERRTRQSANRFARTRLSETPTTLIPPWPRPLALMASRAGSEPPPSISTRTTSLLSPLMKEIAVDFERAKQFEKVKELENAVVELVATYEDCSHFSSAIESVGHKYQPGPELTDFDKLFKNEVAQLKANSSSVPQNHPLIRQFREAVWKVHHAGEPMPGEEQEDIVMTSNQSSILNVTCPLSGKPVTELEHPVRSVVCKHVYDKGHIMHYLRENNTRCPVAACPAKLKSDKVKDDPLLAADIDELRKSQNQNVMTDVMDVTEFEE